MEIHAQLKLISNLAQNLLPIKHGTSSDEKIGQKFIPEKPHIGTDIAQYQLTADREGCGNKKYHYQISLRSEAKL
jgi:hypothetical protein